MAMAFVHPAAVVPLARVRRLDGAALVCGTVGADFEYFATLSATERLHPHPGAVFLAGVVAGFALVALLDVAGPGLARALPPWFGARFAPALTRRLRARGLVDVVAALVVGAALHVLWDALAEHDGALHALVPWRAINRFGTPVGVAVVVAGVALAPPVSRRAAPAPPFHVRALVAVVVGAVVGAGACAALRAYGLGGTTRDVMAAASGGALLGVAVAACALR